MNINKRGKNTIFKRVFSLIRGFCLQDGAFAFRDKIVSLEDGSMDYYHGDEKIGEGKWSAGGI